MKAQVENRLAELRKRRGLGATELARRVNVSRQTIYAIEAGSYVPNTAVALQLARELEVTVDELFTLPTGTGAGPRSMTAEMVSSTPPAQGHSVRICRVGSRWIGVPTSASPCYMPEADGVIQRADRSGGQASLDLFSDEKDALNRLLLAGCDPATGLLARVVEKISGVELVCAAASSKLALQWLKQGKVHIAGSHLEDPKSGEFNLPYIRAEFPGEALRVVTFVRWEEGLVTAPGNPKGLRAVDDVARKNVSFANLE